MRKVKEVFYDKERNSIEVRFDDGGISMPMYGTSSMDLTNALHHTISEINNLEVTCPYPMEAL